MHSQEEDDAEYQSSVEEAEIVDNLQPETPTEE
jgi:hypothetical protein